MGRFVSVYAVTLLANVSINAAAVGALTGVPGRITLAWLVAQAGASTLNFLGIRRFVFPAPTPVRHG